MKTYVPYLCIATTVLCTVIGQIITKWRIVVLTQGKVFQSVFIYYKTLFFDVLFLLGLFCVVPAGLCWVIAIKNIPLSYAYPFIGLTFVFVVVLGAILFHEPLTVYKVVGVLLIVAGVSLIGYNG